MFFDRTVKMVFGRILEIAQNHLKSLNCVFISCPHGPMTNTNRMTYKNELKIPKNFFGLGIEKQSKLKNI